MRMQLPAFDGGDDAPPEADAEGDAGAAMADGEAAPAAGGKKTVKVKAAAAARAATAAAAAARRSRTRILSLAAMAQELMSTASAATDITQRVVDRVVSALWGQPELTDWATFAHLLADGDDDAPLSPETEHTLLRLMATAALRAASGVDPTALTDEKQPALPAPGPVPPGAGSPNVKAPSAASSADACRSARDELTSALALALPGLLVKVRARSASSW